MICKIGDYILQDIWVESISEDLELNYSKIDRINNSPYYQDIGEFTESFKIKGNFIKQKTTILKPLEELSKLKIPVRFTTLKESFLVIITSIKKSKKTFLKGNHLEQSFEITLKRWYL